MPIARTGAPWRWYHSVEAGEGWANPAPYARHDVAVVDIVPGLSAARLRSMFTPLPEAVIIRAYGVGNIPASDPGFVDVLQELREAEVPLIVASQCHQAEVVLGHYEAGSTLARLGAISAHDMTLEALYAKTIFLLSQGLQGEEFAQWMNRSIAGEVSLPGIA